LITYRNKHTVNRKHEIFESKFWKDKSTENVNKDGQGKDGVMTSNTARMNMLVAEYVRLARE